MAEDRSIFFGNLLAAVTNIGAGYCTTWAGIIATRAFNGIGAGTPGAIGAATICDLYCKYRYVRRD